MPQDSESGCIAARWDRETARRVAAAFGAIDLAANSNECRLRDKQVVIKCAAPATNSVGDTYLMLDRSDLVIAHNHQLDDRGS